MVQVLWIVRNMLSYVWFISKKRQENTTSGFFLGILSCTALSVWSFWLKYFANMYMYYWHCLSDSYINDYRFCSGFFFWQFFFYFNSGRNWIIVFFFFFYFGRAKKWKKSVFFWHLSWLRNRRLSVCRLLVLFKRICQDL